MTGSQMSSKFDGKLKMLYEPDSTVEDRDFGGSYKFYSLDERTMVKYSSKWFYPERDHYMKSMFPTVVKKIRKLESVSAAPGNFKFRDIAELRGTPGSMDNFKFPQFVGMSGAKFRVVSITLQKCDSNSESKNKFTIIKNEHTTDSETDLIMEESSVENGIPSVESSAEPMDDNPFREDSETESEPDPENSLFYGNSSPIADSYRQPEEHINQVEPDKPDEHQERRRSKRLLHVKRNVGVAKSHDERHNCTICIKKFGVKSEWQKHMKISHPPKLDYLDFKPATSRFGRTRSVLDIASLNKKY